MDYSALFQQSGTQYGIDPDLLRSVAKVESNFNPNAISPVGAKGLMQMMPDTAKSLGINPNDPAQSIDGAARLLKENIDRYGNIDDGVRAYHGGTDKKNWGPKTENYLDKVSTNFNGLKYNNGVDTQVQPQAPATTQVPVNNDVDAWLGTKPTQTSQSQPQSQSVDEWLGTGAKPATAKPQATIMPSAQAPQVASNAGLNLMKKASIGSPNFTLKDAAIGAMSGLTDVGKTISAPVNYALDKLNPLPNGLSHSQDMDNQFNNLFAQNANTKSSGYQAGKIGGDIVGTLPLGGALGKVVGSVFPRLGASIASGGMDLAKTGEGENILTNAAARIAGGAVNGGVVSGAINPHDTGFGMMAGGALPIATAGLGLMGKTISGIGSLASPFSQSGKEKIIGNMLNTQAGKDANQVINNLNGAQGHVPNFIPTVGQASNSPNLASLQRAYTDANPSLGNVSQTQNKALADAVRGIGGDDLERQALVDARTSASEPLYDSAKNAQVNLTPELNDLMQRPSMVQATGRAQNLAKEKNQSLIIGKDSPAQTINSSILDSTGKPFQQSIPAIPANMTGQSAQSLKMGLDDLLNVNKQTGIGGNELNAIQGTKQDYLSELEKQLPAYAQANSAYKQGSIPINQMDLGNSIANKFIPASSRDLQIPNQLNHEQLAKAVYDNGDKLAQSVTGFKGSTLENTLSKAQLNILTDSLKDIQYIKQGQNLGRPVNSSTFQNMAMNNILNQTGIGKLPVIGSVLKKSSDWIYGTENSKLNEMLGEILKNPQMAASLMKNQLPNANKQALINMLKTPALVNAIPALTAQ